MTQLSVTLVNNTDILGLGLGLGLILYYFAELSTGPISTSAYKVLAG